MNHQNYLTGPIPDARSGPISDAGTVSEDAVTFCERFLELITDLEAQLPTRRFFNTLLDSCSFVVSYLLAAIFVD